MEWLNQVSLLLYSLSLDLVRVAVIAGFLWLLWEIYDWVGLPWVNGKQEILGRNVAFAIVKAATILGLCVLLAISAGCAIAEAKTNDLRYDLHFKRYTERYFRDKIHWKWFKAQAIAESNLSANAVSSAGARGVMQLMPFTSKECARELGIANMPKNPQANIQMGIYYMSKMWSYFAGASTQTDRLKLSQASYNAGAGWVLKAQRRVSCDKGKWECVKNALHPRGKRETIPYVARIEAIYTRLV